MASLNTQPDDLPAKVAKVKKRKAATEQKPVPAGAQGGVTGNAPKEKLTGGLKRLFRQKGSPSGNASDMPGAGVTKS